jgi:diacylglycerol kinase
MVLALETMNTAVEATVDALDQPPSELLKHAKDAAAGSVLIAAIVAVVVALMIFGPRLLSLL